MENSELAQQEKPTTLAEWIDWKINEIEEGRRHGFHSTGRKFHLDGKVEALKEVRDKMFEDFLDAQPTPPSLPEGGVRWVMASERKPEKNKWVIVRVIENRELIILGKHTDQSEDWVTDDSSTWYFYDTEWLDESTATLPEGRGEDELSFVRWLEKNCCLEEGTWYYQGYPDDRDNGTPIEDLYKMWQRPATPPAPSTEQVARLEKEVTDWEYESNALRSRIALLESQLKASKEEAGEFAEWAFAHYQMSLTRIGDRKPVWHPRFMPLDGKTNIKTPELFEIFKQQYPLTK